METRVITRINGVGILASNVSEGLIPIKPICEALGIDYSTQLKKIKEDEDWSSVMGLSPTTGADGKIYEMCCISKKYILAWLLSINPANVKPEARQAVREYRNLCYDILYNYFFVNQEKIIEQNKVELSLLEEISEIKQSIQAYKAKLSEKQKMLERLREERLRNEPLLF